MSGSIILSCIRIAVIQRRLWSIIIAAVAKIASDAGSGVIVMVHRIARDPAAAGDFEKPGVGRRGGERNPHAVIPPTTLPLICSERENENPADQKWM
jgi:hypothetical protein